MVWPIVAAVAAQVAMNEMQKKNTASADKKAKRERDEALAQFNNVEMPELEGYNPELYQWGGDLGAETITAGTDVNYQSIDDAAASLSSDPRLKDAQMSALRSMQEVANNGGMNAEDRANLARIQSEAAQADRGRRDAIMQNMAARGMGGSGNELLAQLQSSQAATDRQAQQGLDVAGMAQRRALEAMMNQGNMAGNIRGQDFSEAAQKAQAANAIAQFNAANQLNTAQFNKQNEMGVKEFNANATNNVNKYNHTGRQDTANSNVDIKNNIPLQNNSIKQQGFNDNLDVANAKAGALSGHADAVDAKTKRESDQNAQVFGNMMNTAATMYQKSDERVKKEIKDIDNDDIAEFLRAVNPKSFKYKGTNEPKVGFIAQDVEHTKIGDKIISEDDNGVKQFDQQSLNGVMLAAIKALAEGKK